MAKRSTARRERQTDTFGKLLRKYREKRGLTQSALSRAVKGHLSASYIVMLEGGGNLPSRKKAESIADALELPPIEKRRLLLAAARHLQDSEGFVPVHAAEVAGELRDVAAVWVVGSVPIEFQKGHSNSVYEAVLRRLSEERTRFVYWTPLGSLGKFDALREQLETDLKRESAPLARIVRGLECIVCPQAVALHQFALYNPFSPEREGRLGILDEDGEVMGAIALSRTYARKLYEFLAPAYDALSLEPEAKEIHECTFQRHYPPPKQRSRP